MLKAIKENVTLREVDVQAQQGLFLPADRLEQVFCREVSTSTKGNRGTYILVQSYLTGEGVPHKMLTISAVRKK